MRGWYITKLSKKSYRSSVKVNWSYECVFTLVPTHTSCEARGTLYNICILERGREQRWSAHAHTVGVGSKQNLGIPNIYARPEHATEVQRCSTGTMSVLFLDTLVVYPPTHRVRHIIPNYGGRGASQVPCCNTIIFIPRGCWGGLRKRIRWGGAQSGTLAIIVVVQNTTEVQRR